MLILFSEAKTLIIYRFRDLTLMPFKLSISNQLIRYLLDHVFLLVMKITLTKILSPSVSLYLLLT